MGRYKLMNNELIPIKIELTTDEKVKLERLCIDYKVSLEELITLFIQEKLEANIGDPIIHRPSFANKLVTSPSIYDH
jgi:hypothetical protein